MLPGGVRCSFGTEIALYRTPGGLFDLYVLDQNGADNVAVSITSQRQDVRAKRAQGPLTALASYI